MASDGKLDSDEYMTILAKFPLGTFNAMNKLDYNFNYYLDMAEDGIEKYNFSFFNDFTIYLIKTM